MSVLLEALKKAAEEKKKSSQEKVDFSASPSDSTSDSLLIIKPVESESLKLGDENLNEPESATEQPVELESQLANEQASIRLSADIAEFPAEKTLSIDDLDLESDSSNIKTDLEPNDVSAEPIILSDETVVNEEQNSGLILTKQHNEDDNIQPEVLSRKNEVEDSYDWSLGKLPGYDEKSVNQPSENHYKEESELPNPILSTNKRFAKKFRLSSIRQFIFGRSSNIAIFVLFSVLVLSIVGFFSVYYFQQQEMELDQNMRKYKLVRTVLPSQFEASNDTQVKGVVSNNEELRHDSTPTNNLPETKEAEYSTLEQKPVPKTKPEQVLTKLTKDEVLEVLAPVAKPVVKPKVEKLVPVSKAPVQKKSEFIITQTNQESDIQRAYTALYNGDLNVANQSFEKVLISDPNNVSALNGYAATQAQLGNDSEAIAHYQKVLSLDSNNLYAFEAMISMLGDSLNGAEWKDEIKRVLEIHSDSAALNYALGNFYAKESDWIIAQTYYFDAYVLDNQNADYLVNLAVSLDHLGQYDLAEKYYTLALVHASGKSLSFDEAQIKQRLAVIRQFIEAGGQ